MKPQTISIFSIFSFTILIFWVQINSTIAQAQPNKPKEQLYALSLSENAFQSADFLTLTPSGQLEVLSEARGMSLFSVGASAVDDWQREYLVWGQSADYQNAGYIFDQKSGALLQTIHSEQSPFDLQYDSRLRRYYGLCYLPQRKGLEVIAIDEGAARKIWTFPNIKFVEVGNTSFDSNRGLYVFMARDAKNKTHLYRINMNDGNILDMPLVDEYFFNELEYDLKDNKLYGLARKRTNITQYFFVEINMLNAYPTIIRPIVNMTAPELGLSSINQKKGTYFFVGQEKDGKKYLYEIDVIGGSFLHKTPVDEKLAELHYNNADFIADFYKDIEYETQKFSQSNPLKNTPKSGDSYPILERFYIRNKVRFDDISFIKDAVIEAIVFDKWGNVVTRQKVFLGDNSIENTVDVADLPRGVYVIRLKTSTRTYSQRFLKD